MKPVKTKAQIRAEIDAQVSDYLSRGGHVAQCRPGESGRESNYPLSKPPQLERSEQTRTPVISEIRAIEARRNKARQERKPVKPRNKEKKSLITDDFGEPLRWITE